MIDNVLSDGHLLALWSFLGAGVSVLVSEIIKRVLGRRSRLDSVRIDQIIDATLILSANARKMLRAVSDRSGRPVDPEEFLEWHREVRSAVDQLRLVGSIRVQRAALLIRHEVYRIVTKKLVLTIDAEDDDKSIYRDVDNSIENLILEVRRSLGVRSHVASFKDYSEFRTRVQQQRSKVRSRAMKR